MGRMRDSGHIFQCQNDCPVPHLIFRSANLSSSSRSCSRRQLSLSCRFGGTDKWRLTNLPYYLIQTRDPSFAFIHLPSIPPSTSQANIMSVCVCIFYPHYSLLIICSIYGMRAWAVTSREMILIFI